MTTKFRIRSVASRAALIAALGAALFTGTPQASARPVDMELASVAELKAAMDAGTLTAERLTQLCLERIAAYDRQGPKLHAVISLNPKAMEIARALDAERKAGKVRGPLHGIPVILKDNIDTVDMPTTGGSVMLEGNMAPDDAYLVKKLRDGGAIILAKVNLGEFANGSQSSLGGQSHNPHDLSRIPAGSSGGTGVGIAGGYAPVGIGTDTGGSIRGPSFVNGIVGLKPTHGLISRDGIIPLGLSLDTGGPMTRSVSDLAVALGVMTGVDPNDDATKKSQGKFETDYTKYLKADALRGARIGVLRDFKGDDPDVDWIFEASLKAMQKAGATLVDVRYPKWFLDSQTQATYSIFPPEFRAQLAQYLKTTGPKYPKSVEEMLARAYEMPSMGKDGAGPNPFRWNNFITRDLAMGTMDDPAYKAAVNYYMPMSRALVEGLMAKDKLDAFVYPTQTRRAARIDEPLGGGIPSAPAPTGIANLTGFPDLIVPAGFTTDDLPVTVSFFGLAFSEPKLISLGYSFEQATKAIRRPVNTPAIAGATVDVPSK